jgi:hypothetical protein
VEAVNADPYKPPTSNVEVPDLKRGSAMKAVALGLLADLGGTTLMSTLASFAYAIYLGATGSTPDQIGTAMANLGPDSALGVGLSILGGLFSVLGGFVCARIAKHSEYRLGLVMSAISLALAALVMEDKTHPAITAILFIATAASIMAGIHLGVLRNRKARAAAAPQ